ncbi:glycosyltransferase [Verrucomicrobia bacterium S94]|nr:glycosyltransferase [Verrucomicrobia bacterium S94]
MKPELAFCLFKYFPFGGLQSDFLAIASACQRRGFRIVVYTRSWEGDIPDGFEVRLISANALSNHGKALRFSQQVTEELMQRPAAAVVGFNRMPGLDIYFAADNCYAAKAATQRGFLYRLGRRYKTYAALEKAVFDPESATEILLIAERQQAEFCQYYGTPAKRMHLLPPGMNRNRSRPDNAEEIRRTVREQLGVRKGEIILIQVGSGFVTKGVDRSIRALTSLPSELKKKTRLLVVGKDRSAAFRRLAKKLGEEDRVDFLGGRDDVPSLLLAADLMIHPAVNEAAGIVLLEALAAGLPVLCSAACGHAVHVERSGGGLVSPEPFDQEWLNRSLLKLVSEATTLPALGRAGLAYAEKTDFYSQHERAAEFIADVVRRKS